MGKKNIVSIEDRIPRLKEERKKKANRRLIFYLSILFFLISIIVYLQSPLSHIKTINVSGNTFIPDDEIIQQSGLSNDTNMWMMNQSEIEQSLQGNSAIIESVDINRQLPWTVEIAIREYERVGYIKDEHYFPVLGSGEILGQVERNTFYGDAPLLIGFTEDEYLHRMAGELEKLPDSIFDLISEIHWQPTEENKNEILLYMNDGHIVEGTIRNFAENMDIYPSIVSQLDSDEEGIIHIGVGVYFESFQNDSEDEENGSSSEAESTEE